ncbi:hypothetical protein HMPREF1624_08708 [Sporothrix schenckii ATCC 58251]|uniref:DDHD domain-containing protein n=1 Tax=Sporothrix schenckii (strain ATCC 58251 / de Perez 2211183) TaxID=1391915 RepID=U7PJB0_SPOS1|nr:hypothetical protein HMPREF1624_08708 [Sporothrix schenckii ATCC 58251]
MHNLGPGCHLAPIPQPQTDSWLNGIPPSNAQFFYSSTVPIDDPILIPSNDSTSPKRPLRPFSQADSNRLERAWLQLFSEDARENHLSARLRHNPSPPVIQSNEDTLDIVVRNLTARHRLKHLQDRGTGHDAATTVRITVQGAATSIPVCCEDLLVDARGELRTLFCPLAVQRRAELGVDAVTRSVMVALNRTKNDLSNTNTSTASSSMHLAAAPPIESNSSVTLPTRRGTTDGPDEAVSHLPALPSPIAPLSRLPIPDDGISGKPFLRPGIPSEFVRSSASPSPPFRETETLRREIQSSSLSLHRMRKSFEVAVGISRLYTVDLPALQMKPIYWSPVHDISAVQRATWFYRDTMMPLEADVSNQLESLFRELRPWTETWKIELRCAVDIGPIGEEKVSQPLWPSSTQDKTRTRTGRAHPVPKISSDPFCASHCFQGTAAAVGTVGSPPASYSDRTTAGDSGNCASPSASGEKCFANYDAIFKDGTQAFLLKPSLRPSAYYRRQPVAKICKGATVGIPIVRGFDRDAWNRIHNQSPRGLVAKSFPAAPSFDSAAIAGNVHGHQEGVEDCPGCRAEKLGCQVSDLVLVIHGVGQKLAERVESFHFTHAVNGLRRAVSAELKTPVVQSVLRDGHSGIMVLPVNWRHTLSFEDGGFSEPRGEEGHATTSGFELKDIEQTSIPAVRSMISDVMFDIPFYMSNHKPKMITSLVREANRVYRLWCQNNPGFSQTGRVHLIGHSLGSAMAVEVLSKQPTKIPRVEPIPTPAVSNFFEFDTTNLFLLGSPAAFFLLLERGALVPRRGRQKPGMVTRNNIDRRVFGEAGTFGCLAVDNIYNVLAKEDPIAYLLNGTIDSAYASGLKTAYVPSASVSLFASISQSLRGVFPGMPTTPHQVDNSLSTTALPAIVRLPSQVELEVHDFTREEIAEHKAYLLNDNGQVDYFLQSGGGPLEIQYLNMLSAHTSYWTNQDLIRMLCVEIGRRPGTDHTMPTMRAVKSFQRPFQPSARRK